MYVRENLNALYIFQMAPICIYWHNSVSADQQRSPILIVSVSALLLLLHYTSAAVLHSQYIAQYSHLDCESLLSLPLSVSQSLKCCVYLRVLCLLAVLLGPLQPFSFWSVWRGCCLHFETINLLMIAACSTTFSTTIKASIKKRNCIIWQSMNLVS